MYLSPQRGLSIYDIIKRLLCGDRVNKTILKGHYSLSFSSRRDFTFPGHTVVSE